jgi:hypothetical protein
MVSRVSSPHQPVLFRPNISFNKTWRPIHWKKTVLVHDWPPHPVQYMMTTYCFLSMISLYSLLWLIKLSENVIECVLMWQVLSSTGVPSLQVGPFFEYTFQYFFIYGFPSNRRILYIVAVAVASFSYSQLFWKLGPWDF